MNQGGWKYFSAGAELDAVKSIIECEPLYRFAQASVSQVALSSWARSHETEVNPTQKLIAQLVIGVLTRGWPTLSGAYIEHVLLKRCESITGLPFKAYRAEDVLQWRLDLGAEELESVCQNLISGLLPIDSRLSLRQDLPFGSQAEYRLFKWVLEPLLGPAIGWVELQRPLNTIIEDERSSRFRNQAERVDFSFEMDVDDNEPFRFIVEVDGPQHNQAVQSRLDRSRDDRTRKAGWPTFRVRVADSLSTSRDIDVLKEALARRVNGHHYLAHLRIAAVSDEPSDPIPILLACAPHAIHRIQLALLDALSRGSLHFDQAHWDIGIVERDVRCAGLAVADLLRWLQHFATLYDSPPIPPVRITAYDATDRDLNAIERDLLDQDCCELEVFHSSCPDSSFFEHDLVIDVAVRSFTHHAYRNDPYEPLMKRCKAASTVRTAPRSPGPPQVSRQPAVAIRNPADKQAPLRFVLQQIFRKNAFREGQLEIIHRALNRQSTIGLLPTGAGKSLTYQLPALISPGMTIVIDPIKSLMQDQADNLRAIGIHSAAAINSDQNAKDRERETQSMASGNRRFVFISPERLQIEAFRNDIRRACEQFPIAYFVIDEAHCVSEWGHDFRTSYLRIGQLARELCQHNGHEPPILALTATASSSVLSDVQREIGLEGPESIISPTSFDRSELSFHIVRVSKREKHQALVSLLLEMENRLIDLQGAESISVSTALGAEDAGIIVFCPHVNGSLGVSSVRDYISHEIPILNDRVEFYSGEAPKGFRGRQALEPSKSLSSNSSRQKQMLADEWAQHKADVQRRFKNNEIPLLVATSAFGMGIDKPNIRYTVHFAMTKTIEDFAQQAGRAGRDRQPALCSIIFSDNTHNLDEDPLAIGISSREAVDRMNRSYRQDFGDTGVVMFLHSLGYLGIEEEIADICAFYHQTIEPRFSGQMLLDGEIEAVVSQQDFPLGDVNQMGITSAKTRSKTSEDRTLYRLALLGVITDYTVKYSTSSNVYKLRLKPPSDESLQLNLKTYVRRYKLQDGVQRALHSMMASQRPYPIDRAVEALTIFIYEEIEKKRREGMANMRQLLRDSTTGEELRDGIRNFLDHNAYTDRVFELLSRLDDTAWWQIIDSVTSEHLASQLLGQCQRALETNPDHAGVRILSGLARAKRPQYDITDITTTIDAGLRQWEKLVEDNPSKSIAVARKVAERLHAISPWLLDEIIEQMVLVRGNATFARGAYPYASTNRAARICALPMLQSIQQRVSVVHDYHLEFRQ